MTNYLAIATVTATLHKFLQDVVQIGIDGAKATTVRPNEVGGATPETGLNIFLYQVVNNAMWGQSADMRSRGRLGEMTKRWRSAVDLHYMISFYGNDVLLEPQLMMGRTIQLLNDQRVLSKDLIQETLSDPGYKLLEGSKLVDQVEEINIMPLDLSLEDLSKVWSVFFQTPYRLSIAYRASVVIIEGEEPSQIALPLRARQFGGVMPFSNQPKIDLVIAQAGKLEPIVADSILSIQGKNLKGNITQVLIDGIELKPTEITATQIILPLSTLPPDRLRAGMHSLQVIHRLPKVSSKLPPVNEDQREIPSGPPLIPAVQSNVVPFVLRPTITKVSLSKKEGGEDEPRQAEVKVRTNLTIGKQQRVVLALNEMSINNPAAYLFEAPPRRLDGVWVTIPIYEVKPGRYLVRLQVDGAESQLTVDTQRNSSTFNQYIGPKILIK